MTILICQRATRTVGFSSGDIVVIESAAYIVSRTFNPNVSSQTVSITTSLFKVVGNDIAAQDSAAEVVVVFASVDVARTQAIS